MDPEQGASYPSDYLPDPEEQLEIYLEFLSFDLGC
jgi:hypothetical protein